MQISVNNGNSQITPEAKAVILSWFESQGVPEITKLVLHHYQGGDYVCVSYNGEFEHDPGLLDRYNQAAARAVRSHAENKFIDNNYGTIWVCREWVNSLLETPV